jgi:intracellular septation protein
MAAYMKLLFDFLPIVLFFIAYKFGGGTYHWSGQEYQLEGIYVATAVMIITSILQTAITWLLYKKVEKSHLITLALVITLGGATLWLHNPEFIMWKPTLVNWLFAAGFAGTQLLTDKSLLERMMSEHITMKKQIWTRLNIAWIVFFIASGILNLYVAFNYDEATWVNFKLFGLLGLTLIFIIGQTIYLSRHAQELTNKPKDNQ